jgi:hypothetical protein
MFLVKCNLNFFFGSMAPWSHWMLSSRACRMCVEEFHESIMGKLSPVNLIKWASRERERRKIQFTIPKWTINGTMGEINYERSITSAPTSLVSPFYFLSTSSAWWKIFSIETQNPRKSKIKWLISFKCKYCMFAYNHRTVPQTRQINWQMSPAN